MSCFKEKPVFCHSLDNNTNFVVILQPVPLKIVKTKKIDGFYNILLTEVTHHTSRYFLR